MQKCQFFQGLILQFLLLFVTVLCLYCALNLWFKTTFTSLFIDLTDLTSLLKMFQ